MIKTKTIKFNLICDDKPIRTIEDLQNNFSIEDVLEYYNNKLLHRWLEVRGYTEELGKINEITAEKSIDIIKELIKIFNIASNEKKIEESVYVLEYLKERQNLYSEYEKENYNVNEIINDYRTGYEHLVDEILENPDDVARIKANIKEITENYAWILKLNHRNLFFSFMIKSRPAIMCLLMNEQSRKYYLPIEKKNEDGTISLDTDSDKDKAYMYQAICSMILTPDFETILGEELITFAGETDGYWKDLEPKGKKYMIISMGTGDFVRSAGLSGGDLGSVDILNKFVILDGIDYKSNSANRQLLYMEV